VLIEYRVFLIFYDGDYLFFHYLDRARDNGVTTQLHKKSVVQDTLLGGGKWVEISSLGEAPTLKGM
jgi:hypothetical protein